MTEGNTPGISTERLSGECDTFTEDRTKMNPENEMNGACAADDAVLQRFLAQKKSDLMQELQHINSSERPVTGQNNRVNIANFMAKHSQVPAGDGNKENVPANVDAVEDHRPEAVVVEVQGVVEQRRVSSMLQSSNFRRHLENIIRSSISTARQPTSGATSRTRASNSPRPSTPVVPVTSDVIVGTTAEATAATSSADTPVTTVAATPARSPSSSQESVSDSNEDVVVQDSDSYPSVVRPPSPTPQLGVWTPVRQAAPVAGERQMWDAITQSNREDMVFEISDLVHRQLVSSMLSSEFRTVMEVHLQNQLSDMGTNGEAVANFIRNIPQSDEYIHNDFSHLGIAPGVHDDNSDNISITGISATAVPYTQTNLHLSRELQSLRSQMEEMKNMLRLSFDLQMDIQRSIRQEVAAALASVTAQGATAAAPPMPVHSTPVNDTHCLICLDNCSDSVLYQCGHMCVCYVCGKNLVSHGNGKCPVCRAPIKDIIRAYKTNSD